MNTRKVRVRFAPSPTGPLHMGGVRTALYNYLFAKKHGGDFILRIEDTDQTRFVEGATEYIIESLKWCGIEPNKGYRLTSDGDHLIHGLYKQSDRNKTGVYRRMVDKLVDEGKAYYAFDTKEDLDAMRDRLKATGVKTFSYNGTTRETMKNSLTLSSDEVSRRISAGDSYVIRIKMPRNEDIRFNDLIRGNMIVKSNVIDDKVLFKSDGMPTYHLANVVDDHEMEITHVIRGEEWLPSAPLHVILYKYFGWEDTMPEFAHLPLIMAPSGSKLSKRDGDALGFPVFPLEWTDPATGEVSSGYREKGYLPEAFLNMIALLGWNPGGNVEIMSLDEMVDRFSFERVGKAGAKFDLKKADWINKKYMTKTNNHRLADLWIDNLAKRNITLDKDKDYIAVVCGILKEKMSCVDKFWDIGSYFFNLPLPYITKSSTELVFLTNMSNNLEHLDDFIHDKIKTVFNEGVKTNNIDARDAGRLLRECITGLTVGPPLFDVIPLLGKAEVVKRLKFCITKSS